jgi:hypothetical protein
MNMAFCFPIEMSYYNQKLRTSVLSLYVLVNLLVMKFELTKIDKFIEIT